MRFALVALLLGGCDVDELTNTPPVIQRLPFDVAPYDATTQRAGSFDFKAVGYIPKILVEFGGVAVDDTTGSAGVRLYQIAAYLPVGTRIYAPADGEITEIERNIHGDESYELRIRTSYDSRWEVSVENMWIDEAWATGMTIHAGDFIGDAVYRSIDFEVRDLAHNTLWCPRRFYGDHREVIEGQLTQLEADWETYRGDASLYDESAMFAPGCDVESYDLVDR